MAAAAASTEEADRLLQWEQGLSQQSADPFDSAGIDAPAPAPATGAASARAPEASYASSSSSSSSLSVFRAEGSAHTTSQGSSQSSSDDVAPRFLSSLRDPGAPERNLLVLVLAWNRKSRQHGDLLVADKSMGYARVVCAGAASGWAHRHAGPGHLVFLKAAQVIRPDGGASVEVHVREPRLCVVLASASSARVDAASETRLRALAGVAAQTVLLQVPELRRWAVEQYGKVLEQAQRVGGGEPPPKRGEVVPLERALSASCMGAVVDVEVRIKQVREQTTRFGKLTTLDVSDGADASGHIRLWRRQQDEVAHLRYLCKEGSRVLARSCVVDLNMAGSYWLVSTRDADFVELGDAVQRPNQAPVPLPRPEHFASLARLLDEPAQHAERRLVQVVARIVDVRPRPAVVWRCNACGRAADLLNHKQDAACPMACSNSERLPSAPAPLPADPTAPVGSAVRRAARDSACQGPPALQNFRLELAPFAIVVADAGAGENQHQLSVQVEPDRAHELTFSLPHAALLQRDVREDLAALLSHPGNAPFLLTLWLRRELDEHGFAVRDGTEATLHALDFGS